MCSRRVFSNDRDLNFSEYNTIIKGEQIYKNIKSKGSNIRDNNYTIVNDQAVTFLDYQTFLTLTKTYFKYYVPPWSFPQVPYSINGAKNSYLLYNTTLTHINSCEYCSNCEHNCEIYDCNKLQNILYPYGSLFKEYMKPEAAFAFPAKLNFSRCNNKCNYICDKQVEPCETNCCPKKLQNNKKIPQIARQKIIPECVTPLRKPEIFLYNPSELNEIPFIVNNIKCNNGCIGIRCCTYCAKGRCCSLGNYYEKIVETTRVGLQTKKPLHFAPKNFNNNIGLNNILEDIIYV